MNTSRGTTNPCCHTYRMLSFNAGDGYSEAIVRGYRMGLLTTSQYSSLTQCETLEGKVALQKGVVISYFFLFW